MKVYKNILIISDNLYLCDKLSLLLKSKKILKKEFTYSISPFSKKIEFEVQLKKDIFVFDLKSEDDIDTIIKNFDLVISIHCKQIFPHKLINSVKCINVHPGYNPINRGWYPQVFSIINNLPIGATIHEIDEKLDHGKIIAREFVEKKIYDTSESLYNRIIIKELELLDKYIIEIINGNYATVEPENEGNLNLKKDFNQLKEIRLNESMEVIELINRLRALTHGNFNNAYFIDPDSGRKVFVSINLKSEDEH